MITLNLMEAFILEIFDADNFVIDRSMNIFTQKNKDIVETDGIAVSDYDYWFITTS